MHYTKQITTLRPLLQKGLLGLFAVAIIGFIGFKLYPLVHGPVITFATLRNGQSVSEPMIKISGVAEFTQQLSVNGKLLDLSPEGSFDEKIVLSPGYNIIHVQGKDRFGTSNQETYRVVLTEKETPPILTLNTTTDPLLLP